MAIVVYKCDVCKRDVELERNVEGLENIQRCTITHGCRGKLYQIQVFPDFVRGRLPDQVAGLDDWRQRKVLYNHIQAIQNDTWIIKHDLGTFPSVSVFINAPTEDDPDNIVEIQTEDTIIIDEDNLILKFGQQFAGQAQLVARQSDPDLLRPITGVKIPTVELQQVSASSLPDSGTASFGEITIATRISTVAEPQTLELGITYTNTENDTIDKVYVADANTLGSVSPWRDIDRVIIKGKVYTIRTFTGLIPEIFDETISSGSTFIFNTISSDNTGSPISYGTHRAITQDEVYLLYASSPFDTVDKLTDQYIDVFDVSTTQNPFAFVYDTGEFFATPDVIRTIYPLIRSVI